MFRICIAALTSTFILALAATPSAAEELKNDSQPTACDCSNCSAEHCQPGRPRGAFFLLRNNQGTSAQDQGNGGMPMLYQAVTSNER